MSITLVPFDIVDVTSNSTRITDLTTGYVDGDGVFDKILTVIKLHIDAEFQKGRITGKEYATVFFQLVSAALQSSVAFLAQSKEIEKLNAEIGLLRQKTVSELANTSDALVEGLGFNLSTSVAGSVSRQNNLYEAQTAGFSRDAEQKLAKILVDTWSVRRTTDDATIASATNGLGDAEILEVLNVAKAGIGITAP